MPHRGPFEPDPSHDSVILWYSGITTEVDTSISHPLCFPDSMLRTNSAALVPTLCNHGPVAGLQVCKYDT